MILADIKMRQTPEAKVSASMGIAVSRLNASFNSLIKYWPSPDVRLSSIPCLLKITSPQKPVELLWSAAASEARRRFRWVEESGNRS